MSEKVQEKLNHYKKNRKKITFYYLYPNDFNFDINSNIALIIPFLDKEDALIKILDNELIKSISPKIFVFKQSGDKKFNKGILYNIAIKELSNQFNRIILHDMNFLPNLELEKYYLYQGEDIIHLTTPDTCPLATHNDFFGGVLNIKVEDFIKINGFPNHYFQLGGEFNLLYDRVAKAKIKVCRPTIGRYTVLSDAGLANPYFDKNGLIHSNYCDNSGVNNLNYNIVSIENHSDYYEYTVNF